MNQHDVIIVGGGPVGLYVAGLLEKQNRDYLLLEAATLGGQPLNLYPEKMVDDVPEFPAAKSADIVANLISEVKKEHVREHCLVERIETNKHGFLVSAGKNRYEAKDVIIATGLGFYKPRPLGLIGEEKAKNILYALKDPFIARGKNVALFGGGDSALDWARELAPIAKSVALIHRRTEFRGNPKTIEGLPINLYLPYVPLALTLVDQLCTEVVIQNVADQSTINLPVDLVLVNFGQIPSPSSFGLPLDTRGFGIAINPDTYEAAPHLFALGDCAYRLNTPKRMEPAFAAARLVVDSLR